MLPLHTSKHSSDDPDGMLILKHDSIQRTTTFISIQSLLIHCSHIHQQRQNCRHHQRIRFPACSTKTIFLQKRIRFCIGRGKCGGNFIIIIKKNNHQNSYTRNTRQFVNERQLKHRSSLFHTLHRLTNNAHTLTQKTQINEAVLQGVCME